MIPTFRPLLVLFIIPTICSKSLISFLPAMLAHCTDYQWLPIGTMATSTQHDTHHVMSQFSLGQQIFLNVAKNTYSLLKHLGVGNKGLNECFRKKTERWERRRRRPFSPNLVEFGKSIERKISFLWKCYSGGSKKAKTLPPPT